ncbi:fungal chitosanase [Colletotrichum orchidophilum]|uniref:Endo-chitosanase n=1 Tax=Colletotrichum orchidophilum TaxID=1209926 RepID=A0A1G4ASG5_9PEZI|nr:fungal chitosanase [Colletotrichum orchidophilum]OHE92055.1 fungal chitosanase [Colletotrichum orchidophilum]
MIPCPRASRLTSFFSLLTLCFIPLIMVSLGGICLLFILLATPALTRDIPSNLQDFYAFVRGRNKCHHVLASGFHSSEGDSGGFGYCGDYLDDYKIIYLQGKNGELANMDVDCDGEQAGGDGRCGSSTDTQSETTFHDELRGYGTGRRDLNASVHTYVVFGNEGTKSGWPTFDPAKHGVKPLSVMAVICNNKLLYGVWGDTNGDDGPQAMVGEASISLATACYGNSVNGNSGHDDNDVLYIAFTGNDAVPGASGANWTASNYEDFQSSITNIGNRLIERVGSDGNGRPLSDQLLLGFAAILGIILLLF